MLEIERRIAIVNQLNCNKTVTVNELSDSLGVAKTTVRKDLSELEKGGVLTRIHGGAILNEDYTKQTDYSKKSIEDLDIKLDIAKKAIEFVQPNMFVALNTSTITTLIAQELPNQPMTLVTNSLDICEIIAHKNQINLICTGGNYIHKHRSFEGPVAVKSFSQFSYHVSFIGANGIHSDHGISTKTFLESEAKKTILNNSIEKYIVAQTEKFEKIGLIKVSEIEGVTGIITEKKLNSDIETDYLGKTKIIY